MMGRQLFGLSIVFFVGALVLLGSAVVLYLQAFAGGWTVSAVFDGILGGIAVAAAAYTFRLGLELTSSRTRTAVATRPRAHRADRSRSAA